MSARGFIGIADKYLPYYVTDEELFPGAAGCVMPPVYGNVPGAVWRILFLPPVRAAIEGIWRLLSRCPAYYHAPDDPFSGADGSMAWYRKGNKTV